MKTRSKKPSASKAEEPSTSTPTLSPSITNPPHVFILPNSTSADSRIITLPNPATSTPTRYLLCPEKGCYEFTRIAAPKRACRSWLLAPDQDVQADDEGYVLQSPDLMVATPVDPLFLILPALAKDSDGARNEYLEVGDYLARVGEQSPHFTELLRQDEERRFERMFEARVARVCDEMDTGGEKMYTLSKEKLLSVLLEKAKTMVEKGLPASLEQRFVKEALAVPMLSVRREESGVSIASEQESEGSTSQDTQATDATTASSVSTAATSTTSSAPTAEQPGTNDEKIRHLLRLRTALDFLLTSYIPLTLRNNLQTLISTNSTIDFAPLDTHLAHLSSLKKQAQALRSLSDNISRKRPTDEGDDEAMEKAEAKKRKKEEEQMRKKNTSRGVKQLEKVDRSGMKSLSSFFSAKSVAKTNIARDSAAEKATPPAKFHQSSIHNETTLKDLETMAEDSEIYATVDTQDDYIQPLILAALKARLPPEVSLTFVDSIAELPLPTSRYIQWRAYEALDFDHLLPNPSTSLANSYIIRKALIRKHYLANTVRHWLAKHPDSILAGSVKLGVEFEVDYTEFLDEALDGAEAWELRDSWRRNEELDDRGSGCGEKEWWILKPGMSDRGMGIRLFSSEEELKEIFEGWDPPDDEDDENEDDPGHAAEDRFMPNGSSNADGGGDGIYTSHLRHFIAQPYIQPPLLLSPPHSSAGRKFHIRTYVLAVGALKVYVYKRMLALFAADPYNPPGAGANEDLASHLTNTCLQTGEREGSVEEFWNLPSTHPDLAGSDWRESVFSQISTIASETFEAAARSMSIHFQALPNAFEVFGLDFLVDAKGSVWLLEVNAFPDFKQTGEDLKDVVAGLWEGVVDLTVRSFCGLERGKGMEMKEVLNLDLGRR